MARYKIGIDLAALGGRIDAHLGETLRVSTEFEWLPSGALPREAHKRRLVEDGGQR